MRLCAVRAATIGCINSNVVIPGVTATEAWRRLEASNGMDAGSTFESVKKRSPMGESLTPRDIGDVVSFLSGDQGGRFITFDLSCCRWSV